MRVSCVGDSITAGLGIEDLDDIYPKQLEYLLGGNYIVNPYFGKSGAAVWHQSPSPYTTSLQYNKAKNWKTDVLVVCLGSNDTVNQINDTFKEQFVEDYHMLIAGLKKNSLKAKTYICKIPPIFGEDNVTFAERVPIINVLIEDVAKRAGASLIDLNALLISREDCFFSDGLHPNELGAGLIAETVYNAIKRNHIKTD